MVGDLAQSTGPWARDSWDDVEVALRKRYPGKVEQLKFGYRVPKQIFDFAAKLLPSAAPHVKAPQVVREGPSEPETIASAPEGVTEAALKSAREYASLGLFVAIVCDSTHHATMAAALKEHHVSFDDAQHDQFGKSINLLSAEQVKGLEFDAVVVVEPAQIAERTEVGLRLLYVALTRTTRHLTICYSRGLPVLGLLGPDPYVVETGDVASATGPAPNRAPHPSSGMIDQAEGLRDQSLTVPSNPGNLTSPSRLRRALVRAVAAELAGSIRGTVEPDIWLDVLDQLRRELGVSVDDLLDMLRTGRD